MKGPLIYYPIAEMYGTDLSSTKLSSELRSLILEEIDLGFNVEIDLKNVRTLTNGWVRNAFGLIIKDKGYEFFKQHIQIINMSQNIRQSILEGIDQVTS